MKFTIQVVNSNSRSYELEFENYTRECNKNGTYNFFLYDNRDNEIGSIFGVTFAVITSYIEKTENTNVTKEHLKNLHLDPIKFDWVNNAITKDGYSLKAALKAFEEEGETF